MEKKPPAMAMGINSGLQRIARRIFANGPTWVLVAGVIIGVAFWRAVVLWQRPANLGKITREYGSVAEFWGEPVPNPAGTRLVFQQSTEAGVGIFFAEIPNGRRQLLYQKAEKGFSGRDFYPASWSPDGQQFAYARREGSKPVSELLICDGNTGATLADVKVDGNLKKIVWLSPDVVVYLDEEQSLHRIEKLGGQRWRRAEPFQPLVDQKPSAKKKKRLPKAETSGLAPVLGLTAATGNSVVFIRERALWCWEFGKPQPVKLWEATTNELVDCSMELNGRQILLQCKESAGTSYFQLDWRSGDAAPRKLEPPPESAGNGVLWFQGGGCAWLRAGTLQARVAEKEPLATFAFAGGINSFVSNGRELYIVGSCAGEPVAVWKYDPRQAAPACVLSNALPAFRFARAVVPSQETTTGIEGRKLSYRVWSPPPALVRKKCPLLVGQVGNRWLGYPALIANGGAYFISVDQSFQDDKWADALAAVCKDAKSRLMIDAENIYLYGTSGETPHVCNLLESQPESWRGALLFSPVAYPDLRNIGRLRILLDCGERDHADRAAAYQDEAARAGITVTLAVHENAGHVYRSITSLRERDESVMKFLFGR